MNTIKINNQLKQWGYTFLVCIISALSSIEPSVAQSNAEPPEFPAVAQDRPRSRQPNSSPFNPPTLPSEQFPPLPPPQPLPQPPIEQQLPPPDQLIPQPQPSQPLTPGDIPGTIRVQRFEIVGSTIFTPEELSAVTAPYVGRDLSFAQLLQVRSDITQIYVDQGYITSGAVIPPQTIEDGVVTIQVVEGRLETINAQVHDGSIPATFVVG